MNDEIKEKLLKEIKKYPKKQNYESGLSGYCLKVIDSTDKLNRFEKKSFSEILSRWVLEERLDQHEETSKAKDEEFIKILYKYFGDDKYIDWTAEELYEGIKEDLKENKE